jgi:uncharacterized protein with predicted RNA binding PUA domain
MDSNLKRVKVIADYQFGRGVGAALFPENVEFQFSSTGRVRQILHHGDRLATMRAKDGMLTLSIKGAQRIHGFLAYPKMRVVVNSEAAPYVSMGKNAFSRHVVEVDPDIRAGDEVLIVDKEDRLLGTGQAKLSPEEMLSFKKGVAVEVRYGIRSS